SSNPSITNVECRKKNETTWVAAAGNACAGMDISTPTVRMDAQDANSGLMIGQQPLGVSSGTVLYLDFEEWPPVDKSGYNQVVSTRGADGLTQAASGRFGYGVASNDNGGYVSVSTVPQLSSNEQNYTIEAWYKVTDQGGRGVLNINGVNAYIADSGGSVGNIRTAGNFDTGRDHTRKNIWEYVAITCSGAANKTYLNGKQIASGSSCNANLNGNLNIAGAFTGANAFNGTIDEVRVVRRALSPEEIAANYFSGARKLTRDGGTTWIIDPSTFTDYALTPSTINAANGTTAVVKATSTIGFWNANAAANQFVLLLRDRVGNTSTVPQTAVANALSAPTLAIQCQAHDNDSYSDCGDPTVTTNDLTPNIQLTATSNGPAPLRISSAPISISSDTVLYFDFEEWPPRDQSGYGNHVSSIQAGAIQAASGFHGKGLSLTAAADGLIISR
ncbi:MAG: LamG domain-containing protein, partial [Elusimicrobiota bacterium]